MPILIVNGHPNKVKDEPWLGSPFFINGDIMNIDEWEKKVSNIGWDNTRGPIVHDILKDWEADRKKLLDEISSLNIEVSDLFNETMMLDRIHD